MPKTILRLIRHGVTHWNYDGRAQGQTDIPLAPEGEQQALQAAQHLAGEEWDGLYTSDLLRARRSAEVIGQHTGLYSVADPYLRERAFGVLEGHTAEENKANHGHNPGMAEGVESVADLQIRAMRSLERIAIAHPDERILVVSHGALIRFVVEQIGASAAGMIGNLSFTDLVYENGTWSVALFNDERHMTPPPGLEGLALAGTKYIIGHDRTPLWQAFIAQTAGLALSAAELGQRVNQALAVEIATLNGSDHPVGLVLATGDETSARVEWRLVHPDYQDRPVLAVLEERLRARYPHLA